MVPLLCPSPTPMAAWPLPGFQSAITGDKMLLQHRVPRVPPHHGFSLPQCGRPASASCLQHGAQHLDLPPRSPVSVALYPEPQGEPPGGQVNQASDKAGLLNSVKQRGREAGRMDRTTCCACGPTAQDQAPAPEGESPRGPKPPHPLPAQGFCLRTTRQAPSAPLHFMVFLFKIPCKWVPTSINRHSPPQSLTFQHRPESGYFTQ